MLSHKHRCIFIHIPKTGGEAFAQLFHDVDYSVPKHATALQLKNFLGNEIWQQYFKFTIVRNPWDQVVSMYFHLRKPLYQRERILQKYGTDLLNPVNACRTACSCDFPHYCKIVFAQKQHQLEEDRRPWPVSHFSPFVEWISDESGEILVDYVGRFERLQQDVDCILTRIGKPPCQLPLKNKSDHQHYSVYYDTPAKELIATHYAPDIDLFSYRFEQPNSTDGTAIITSTIE